MPDATEVLYAYFPVENVGLRLYNHKIRESYNSHVYTYTYSGKTMYTTSSTSLMFLGSDYNNITGWAERHKYSWNSGGTNWVNMTVADGWLPENTLGRGCNTVMWCIPNELEGIADCTGLIWNYGGGQTPAIITNSQVDVSMPE